MRSSGRDELPGAREAWRMFHFATPSPTKQLKETSMRGVRLSLLCALLAVSTLMVHTRAGSSRNDWVSDLRWGGYVIVFRHGATTSDPKTDAMSNPKADPMSNPAAGKPGVVERQLNETGRAQA